MTKKLPLVLSILAFVLAALGTVGPAIAHGVEHAMFAHDSDRVDGRDAVGAGATLADRAGKLVAANANGKIPLDLEVVFAFSGGGSQPDDVQSATATCPAGKEALGGGIEIASGDLPVQLDYSVPATNANGRVTGWIAAAHEQPADPDPDREWSVQAYAVCAAAS
jgi:hypothetical protein